MIIIAQIVQDMEIQRQTLSKHFQTQNNIYLKRDPIEIVSALVSRTSNSVNYHRSKWFNKKSLFKVWEHLNLLS